jgi:hypothetical protein
MFQHKQVRWQHNTEGLTDKGREGLLRHYRTIRRSGIPADKARVHVTGIAFGVWSAKNGGW